MWLYTVPCTVPEGSLHTSKAKDLFIAQACWLIALVKCVIAAHMKSPSSDDKQSQVSFAG